MPFLRTPPYMVVFQQGSQIRAWDLMFFRGTRDVRLFGVVRDTHYGTQKGTTFGRSSRAGFRSLRNAIMQPVKLLLCLCPFQCVPWFLTGLRLYSLSTNEEPLRRRVASLKEPDQAPGFPATSMPPPLERKNKMSLQPGALG